ncbi:hypothetical protein GCK32_021630 [Trichostrongylus colubriformis]|uniref:Uncharacterized protein n=1 Tax=Trichostrongylus colubriformis TaxID=6319 RepID=A0AAN8J3P1_TRICO
MSILLQTFVECLLASFYIFVMIVIVSSKAKVFKNSFFSIFVATGKTSACISLLRLVKQGFRQISGNTSIKSLLMYTVIVFISTMLMCSLQIVVGIAVFIGNDRVFMSAIVQVSL